MTKPKKITKEYYDYNDCSKYLEQKYEYDERDYANSDWTKQEKKFVEETGNIRPSYCSVGKNGPNQYAYPIDNSPGWKYYIGVSEVSEQEWTAANNTYKQWEKKIQ